MKIEEFRNSLEFRNNEYYVDLPRYENKINFLPFNFKVDLVLHRTMQSLEQKNLHKENNEIFSQQQRECIIEKIHVSPEEYGKFIWIPHRPVFKTESQETTKISQFLTTR